MKRNLIIIGAGGYGREISEFVKRSCGYGEEFELKGFIDDTENPLGKFSGYPPVIGKISDYEPQSGDVFVCAIGDTAGRKKCTQIIETRGGEFITLLDKNVRILNGATIGKGCIIQSGCFISCDCVVGNHVHMQGLDIIGHDARVGDWCFFHSNVHIGGAAQLGEGAHLYPFAVVHPRKKIGEYATIGAGSFIFRNVPAGAIMYGNPAKKL